MDVDPRSVGIAFEAKLREWNVPYEYVTEFPLADLKNAEWVQVREAQHIADKDSLGEFRTQMGQGAVYPPIVIMAPDVLVDGNHRVSAAKGLRRKTFPAFVARFPSVDLAKSFGAAINQSNGRRLTSAEAYAAAQTMMTRGMADESIAREIGRSVDTVRSMRRQRQFEERSQKLPELAELIDKVPQVQKAKLASIDHDPAFAEAVKLVASTKPGAKVVNELVEAVKKGRTDTEEIEAVRQFAADLAPAGPPPVRIVIPNEVRQANMQLGGLIKLGQNPTQLLDVASPERRSASVERWTQVRDLAEKVLALYGGN